MSSSSSTTSTRGSRPAAFIGLASVVGSRVARERALRSAGVPAARAGRPPCASRIGQCPGGVGERRRSRVERPRLEHGAAARRLAHAQHRAPAAGSRPATRCRRARSRPPGVRRATMRLWWRVAGQRRHDVRIARRAGRARARPRDLVSGWWENDDPRDAAGGAQRARQPRDLRAGDHAARAAPAAHGVEDDRAYARPRSTASSRRASRPRRGRSRAPGRRPPRAGDSSRRAGIGRDAAGRARAGRRRRTRSTSAASARPRRAAPASVGVRA